MNYSWKHLQIKLLIKKWVQAITAVKWAKSSEFFFVSFSLIWLLSCDIITVMWSKFDHLWIELNSYKVYINQTSRLLCSIHMNWTLSMFNLIWFDRSSKIKCWDCCSDYSSSWNMQMQLFDEWNQSVFEYLVIKYCRSSSCFYIRTLLFKRIFNLQL